MKLKTIHPKEHSVKVVERAIAEGQQLKRSPHVGNVVPTELALILGVSQMGGSIELEMVDTIQGGDQYSSPRQVHISGKQIPIASKKSTSNRVVGACKVGMEGAHELKRSGHDLGISEGDSLLDIHIESLANILPEGVHINLSSQYFASVGEIALQAILAASQQEVQRTMRSVDTDGKIAPHVGPITDIFGLGDKPLQGVLPPLEAMMAIELVKAVTDNNTDTQSIHIGGPDMVVYTENAEIMQTVEAIAKHACSNLGIGSGVTVEYVVPGMASMLADQSFPNMLPTSTISSQYDLLHERQQ